MWEVPSLCFCVTLSFLVWSGLVVITDWLVLPHRKYTFCVGMSYSLNLFTASLRKPLVCSQSRTSHSEGAQDLPLKSNCQSRHACGCCEYLQSRYSPHLPPNFVPFLSCVDLKGRDIAASVLAHTLMPHCTGLRGM